MSGATLSSWLQRVKDIAPLATLTLEVDTIRSGMSPQKLSALPIALHIVVEDYAYLTLDE